MRWIKKGLLFCPDNNFEWMVSYAQIPLAEKIDEDKLRIYFSSRDGKGRSHPTYIEVDIENPQNILHVNDKPILPLGDLGTFDDNGIVGSWIVNYRNRNYFYYYGWNPQVTVSYRLSIGLAISEDGGKTYSKYSSGPICDRSLNEPYFNSAPCVLLENKIWRMWYVSCTQWKIVNDWPEPYYHVKYAESSDGISWEKKGIVCIDYKSSDEAIGRPCVYKENGKYKMFYSYRNMENYRADSAKSYRLGYAESDDGISWIRKDQEAGIGLSDEGWDSEMIAYCHIYEHKDKKYMLYNGNGFGRSGIGYAILEEKNKNS